MTNKYYINNVIVYYYISRIFAHILDCFVAVIYGMILLGYMLIGHRLFSCPKFIFIYYWFFQIVCLNTDENTIIESIFVSFKKHDVEYFQITRLLDSLILSNRINLSLSGLLTEDDSLVY